MTGCLLIIIIIIHNSKINQKSIKCVTRFKKEKIVVHIEFQVLTLTNKNKMVVKSMPL